MSPAPTSASATRWSGRRIYPNRRSNITFTQKQTITIRSGGIGKCPMILSYASAQATGEPDAHAAPTRAPRKVLMGAGEWGKQRSDALRLPTGWHLWPSGAYSRGCAT
eukprot:8801269-Pyramimonas_sp.AAC.1